MQSAPSIFICYATSGADWRQALVNHLRPFETEGHIRVFADDCLEDAEQWDQRIRSELNAASAAICLVSTAFLNSEYIRKVELPALLARRDRGELALYLIEVEPTVVASLTLGRRQIRRDLRECSLGAPRTEQILAALAQEVCTCLRQSRPTQARTPTAEVGDRSWQVHLLDQRRADLVDLRRLLNGAHAFDSPTELQQRLARGPIAFAPSTKAAARKLLSGLRRSGALVTATHAGCHPMFSRGPGGFLVASITESTALMVHPVTAEQYATARNTGRDWQPARHLSWHEAVAFCDTLNARLTSAGRRYRLPTADEWMLAACDLLEATPRPDPFTIGHLNAHDVRPVGELWPSRAGFVDLIGNVAEWTSTPDAGGRLTCGGSFRTDPAIDSLPFHRPADPNTREASIGFRMALE